MLRSAPKMTVILLCASALAGCASAMPDFAKLTGGDTASGHSQKEVAAAKVDKTMPSDLEGGVRQAQLMRYAGQYDDAIRVLSQLMLVASDDPRVVSEYGKTLAEKGRAQDAVEFLNRATELSSNDWTIYSALGVSYDQLGNQNAARTAYEHALVLRPEEPSVLNNYALSRMLAGDADGAHILIARAQAAGGASDSKIAANIALLNKVAPQVAPANVAMAQKPIATKSAPPISANNMPIASNTPPPAQAMPRPVAPSPAPVAQSAPRPITPPAAQAAQRPLAAAQTPRPLVASLPPIIQQKAQPVAPMVAGGVVMQAVPFDPYAGPVAPRATHAKITPAPKPGSPEQAAAIEEALKIIDAKSDTKPSSAKPVDTKTATANPVGGTKPVPVKAAAKDQVPALRMTADARNP
jgi:Flp pilus assembly protein TadD